MREHEIDSDSGRQLLLMTLVDEMPESISCVITWLRTLEHDRVIARLSSDVPCQREFGYYCSSLDGPRFINIGNVGYQEVVVSNEDRIPLVTKSFEIRTTTYQLP